MNDSPFVAVGIALIGMIQPAPDPMAVRAERAYRMVYEVQIQGGAADLNRERTVPSGS